MRKARAFFAGICAKLILSLSLSLLLSGCRDGSIHHHDVRKPEHCVARGQGHCLEVCGLKWSADGRYLASGANDNLACVWNVGNIHEPSLTLRGHQAAVKVCTLLISVCSCICNYILKNNN